MTTERRGIPGAEFVEDVQTYLSQSNLDVNFVLSFLQQERLQQYKLAEMKMLAQQRELQGKIPDIEKCLDVVATLQAKKDTGEATALLQKNLENVKASLEVLLGDLQFLQDQVTISQVTIARIYNWDARQLRIRQPSGTPKDSQIKKISPPSTGTLVLVIAIYLHMSFRGFIHCTLPVSAVGLSFPR